MMAMNFATTKRAVETKLIGGYYPIESAFLLETRSANLSGVASCARIIALKPQDKVVARVVSTAWLTAASMKLFEILTCVVFLARRGPQLSTLVFPDPAGPWRPRWIINVSQDGKLSMHLLSLYNAAYIVRDDMWIVPWFVLRPPRYPQLSRMSWHSPIHRRVGRVHATHTFIGDIRHLLSAIESQDAPAARAIITLAQRDTKTLSKSRIPCH